MITLVIYSNWYLSHTLKVYLKCLIQLSQISDCNPFSRKNSHWTRFFFHLCYYPELFCSTPCILPTVLWKINVISFVVHGQEYNSSSDFGSCVKFKGSSLVHFIHSLGHSKRRYTHSVIPNLYGPYWPNPYWQKQKSPPAVH